MNRSRSIRSLLGAAALLLPALVRAEIVDISWDAAGRYERVLSIAPGKFAEVCGKLVSGRSVAWTFDADRPTNFNIHYHVGNKVVYPAKQDAVQSSRGQLSVAAEEDHCWMWSNPGTLPVRLSLTLTRQ